MLIIVHSSRGLCHRVTSEGMPRSDLAERGRGEGHHLILVISQECTSKQMTTFHPNILLCS